MAPPTSDVEISALLQAVRDNPAQRSALLEEARGRNPAVAAEVESILGFDDELHDPWPGATTGVAALEAACFPAPDIPGYTLSGEISRGGQGAVYRALQLSTKREVAIKVELPGGAPQRFQREIELVARLKHHHIVDIFDSGVTPDGRPYYVMDYVVGEPLTTFVREQRPTLETALTLFAKVCDAVQFAHLNGVIHRDLKPTNVLVDADGAPRLLDFGLAKPVEPQDSLQTMSQALIGTLAYMAPEQALGRQSEIDVRTDIYALGVMLYEMLTGTHPYAVHGPMVDVVRHIAETPPQPLSSSWSADSGIVERETRRSLVGRCPVDEEVATIVLKALSKEPERRYQSAGELAADLRAYLAGEPIAAKRDSTWYVLSKLAQRHYYTTMAFVAVGLAAMAVVSLGVYYFHRSALLADRLSEVKRSNSIMLTSVADLEVEIPAAMAVTRFSLIMWDWEAGRLADASNKYDPPIPPDSSLGRIVRYLLSDGEDPQLLLQSMHEQDRWMGRLAIAERYAKHGDLKKAVEAYEDVLRHGVMLVIQQAVEVRLSECSRRDAAGVTQIE